MNAKAHLEKAIALNPDFAEAYYKLGLLLKEKAILKPKSISGKRLLSIRNTPRQNANLQ